MKTASIHELKKEITSLSTEKQTELLTRLARYKKENKELLTYLLFESHDEESFILSVKKLVDELYLEINDANLYWAKKSLRKILRHVNKFIKYSGLKTTELELRIYFCTKLEQSGIHFRDSQFLLNMYQQQIKKMLLALNALHEDMHIDYSERIAAFKI